MDGLCRRGGGAARRETLKQGRMFFFEKKNQKTSVRLARSELSGWAQTDESLFASFSTEKEDSAS
jgi:hypothetical protein